MNKHAEKLQAILNKETLTPKEVCDGIVTCFLAVNRNFVKRRIGEDTPPEKVDAALSELVNIIFEEHQIDPENPSLPLLKKAEQVLQEQAGFEAEPDLLNNHKNIVETLFSRAKS